MDYWLVKSEPYKFSFETFLREGRAQWDGVRNFEARNNLRSMKVGDRVLFYHSNEGKCIVGVARVSRTAYADPTAPGEDWSVVALEPEQALQTPVTLAAVKAHPLLSTMDLVRRSRLSVIRVDAAAFSCVLELGGANLKPAKSAKRPKVGT
jgi:predicted RNA-binding protein with PUA-like domain